MYPDNNVPCSKHLDQFEHIGYVEYKLNFKNFKNSRGAVTHRTQSLPEPETPFNRIFVTNL